MFDPKYRRSLLLSLITVLMVAGLQGVLAEGSLLQAQQKAADPDSTNHPVPAVPLKIDGVKHKSEDIKKFDGKELYSVIDEHSEAEGVLYVFTSKQKFEAYLEENGHLNTASTGDMQLLHNNESDIHSYFYEDINYNDSSLRAPAGASYEDLRNVSNNSWNDRISSVKATPWGAGTYLYTNVDFDGSALFIEARHDRADLRDYGWNDRASSINVRDGSISPPPTTAPINPTSYPEPEPEPCIPEPDQFKCPATTK